jgi:hypothetical protein
MKTAMLENLMERAAGWPLEAQAELVRSALDIELRYLGGYPLSDDDRAALARSEEDVRQKRFATEQEVAAVFSPSASKPSASSRVPFPSSR